MDLGIGAPGTDGAARKRVTVQHVQKVVARHFGMSAQQLLERTRRHAVARPRQVAMYVAIQLTGASLPEIGRRFGDFDHTTIMYARDKVKALMNEDPDFRREVEGLMRLVQN